MTVEIRAKHTPGPWGVDGDSVSIPGDGPSEWPLIISLSYQTEDGPAYTKSAEANARLIAAAPELLEALEEVLHVYRWTWESEHGTADDERVFSGHPSVKKARAAIVKAIGGG